jgi:tRNA A-37 threonylcarbamoyl transferase component Bud32
VENGTEGDDYMEIEAKILDEMRTSGILTPKILAVDAPRKVVPFAYQIKDKRVLQ